MGGLGEGKLYIVLFFEDKKPPVFPQKTIFETFCFDKKPPTISFRILYS